MLFSLDVEGRSVEVELDTPVELDLGEGKVEVTLRVRPYRVFDFAGVRFHYPRHLGFEADLSSPPTSIWTLDGNNVVIMVQRYEGLDDSDLILETLIESMIEQYGAENVDRKESSMRLGDERLDGTSMRVTVAGTRIDQSLYAFPSGGSSIALMLQDSLTDDDKPTAEAQDAFEMMRETFEF